MPKIRLSQDEIATLIIVDGDGCVADTDSPSWRKALKSLEDKKLLQHQNGAWFITETGKSTAKELRGRLLR